MMLKTGHQHRGVLGHLNQAHLCAALQAEHLLTTRRTGSEKKSPVLNTCGAEVWNSHETLQIFRENVFQ